MDRQAVLDQIYIDMKLLEQLRQQRTSVPDNYINNCLAKKAEIFNSHKNNASQALLATFNFNMVAGKIHDLVRLPNVAYEYFNKATRTNDKDPEAHWRAYNAWMNAQALKIKKGEAVNYGQSERAEFVRLSQKHLDAVLKNPASSARLKVAALQTRARFFDDLAMGNEGYRDWSSLHEVDPTNTEALGRLAAFEIEAGRWDIAKKTLTTLARVAPKNPQVREQLVMIDLKKGDPTDALVGANLALKLFKDNEPLKLFKIQALVELGRYQEAYDELHDPQIKKSRTAQTLKTEARVFEALGLEALKKEELKKALDYFNRSLEAVSQNPALRIKASQELHRMHQSSKWREHRENDYKNIVDYLKPLIGEIEMDSKTIEIQIEAAMETKQLAAAAEACDSLRKLHRYPSSVDSLIKCHKAYKQSGRAQDGHDYLDKALLEPRFKDQRTQINLELGE